MKNNIRNFINKSILKAQITAKTKIDETIRNMRDVLKDDTASSINTDHLLWVAIGAVIALLVLGLLIAIIKTDLMEGLKQKIQAIFNFSAE